jgi:hypothetical protein
MLVLDRGDAHLSRPRVESLSDPIGRIRDSDTPAKWHVSARVTPPGTPQSSPSVDL